MTIASLLPDHVLKILRKTRWNPKAKCSYEGMSGGLWWDDEFPDSAIDACVEMDNWAFRFVIGYRASLIMGEPREELRTTWEQLVNECPDWPGLQPEICSAELRSFLEVEHNRFMRQFESLIDDDQEDS